MAPKRKRGKAPGTSDTVTKVNKASIPISVQAPLSSNSEGAGSAETTTVTPAVLTACRSAVVRSPATSRAALDKHRESIDPDLATVLEIVGGYAIEDGSTPLHESVRQGDVATTQALIVAGADIDAKDANGATPVDLATKCTACWALLKHLSINIDVLTSNPEAIVSVAAAHCAAPPAASVEPCPASALFLQAYQLEPAFLWAPPEARTALFAWAKNTFIAQLAANNDSFEELPDDCAGDVLEYLELTMTREESMHIVAHCSSPPAHAWVRAVVAAAVAARASPQLWLAARRGNLAAVQECLAKGASVMQRFDKENGNAPIMISSCNGHLDIVEVLLEAGACVHMRDNHGNTALYWPCVTGETATVKRLIEAGAEVNVKCMRGETPLIAARGRFTIMKVLLEAGAEIDAEDEYGLTTLLEAANSCYSTDVMKLILEAGADTEAKDKSGKTALIRAIVDNDDDEFVDFTKLLLDAGANMEAQHEDGQTALICAAAMGKTTIVKLLLEAGADKEAKDENGQTALNYVAGSGHFDMVKLLLEAGADKDAEDEDGMTVLMQAAINGHAAIIKLLLRAGADKEAEDEDGRTGLMYAALEGNNDIVKLLL